MQQNSNRTLPTLGKFGSRHSRMSGPRRFEKLISFGEHRIQCRPILDVELAKLNVGSPYINRRLGEPNERNALRSAPLATGESRQRFHTVDTIRRFYQPIF